MPALAPQRILSLCLNLFLCTFILTAEAVAQTQSNKQYTENKADLGLRADARIDPSTLAMSLEIQFGGAPGRAGTSVSSALRYSSKQWRMNFAGIAGPPTMVHTLTRLKFSEDAAAGWTSSLDAPWIEYTGRNQRFECNTGNPMRDDPNVEYNDVCFIARIHLHLPDGSSHELRKSDTPQVFVITNPQPDFTGIFYSTDGARMRFDADAGILYLPDGGRYFFGAEQYGTRYNHQELSARFATQYYDRNGNMLSYSTTNVSDTLGRSYDNPLAAYPTAGDQSYSVRGFNNQNLIYTLQWRNLGDVLSGTAVLSYTSSLKCPSPNVYQSVSPYLYESTASFTHVCADDQLFNPVVLAQVVLPNGQSYQFRYNQFGEIDKLIYPTGGYERFAYARVSELARRNAPYDLPNRGVVDRWVSASGNGQDETHWHYESTGLTGAHKVTITPPDSSGRTERIMYASSTIPASFGFDNPLVGMIYEEAVYDAGDHPLRRTLTDWATETPSGSTRTRNPRVTRTTNLVFAPAGDAQAATTTMQYDSDINTIATLQYDYVSVDATTARYGTISQISIPSTPRRTSETTYLVNDAAIDAGVRANYRARNLIGLPSYSKVRDSVNTIVAQSSVSYDQAEYPLLSYGAVTAWADPGNAVRGLPTTSRTWLNTNNTWLESHVQYDACGNPRNSWDPKGNQSQVEYSSTYAYAYPTLTRSAVPDPTGQYGSTTALVSTTVYDFSSGLVTSTTDANNQTTTLEYNDSLRRLTKINSPDGGYRTNIYIDSHPCGPFVETKTSLEAGRETDSWQFFDGVGRPYLAESFDGQDASNPYLRVDTQYDSMGRAWRTSNPYRTPGCTSTLNPSGQWTTTGFDALGRVLSVSTPDNAVVSTAYSGATVTVTDQAGKQRRSVTDALGRLKEVYEDPNGLNYLTSYSYDTLDDLTTVTQGSQTRTFAYDSLKRLTSSTNPESGTISYQYDPNGNLIQKTDARGVVATYTYDALNRNRLIDYSDTTPDAYRQYDMAVNGKGRINQTWQSGSATSMTNIDQYDALGRPSIQRQRFETGGVWSGSYQVQRSYDLAGHVKTQIYPSGHTVTYNYDLAGRLADKDASNLAFTGSLGDGVARTYAAGVLYSPFGGMSKERFGTDTALYNKLFYNVRGQLAEIRVGTYSTDEGWWNRGAILNVYSDLAGWTESREDNNGNLRKQMIYIPGNDQISSYTDSAFFYYYDALNRLDIAREVVSGQNSWVQDYDYDRYGNRTINAANTWGTGINNKQFTVNTANNRLGVPGGQTGTMSYDNAGNLTTDTYSASAITRAYDAENRMTSETQANNYVAGSYGYNADGQRVRRAVNGVETWQIYGLDGELVAEYAANASAASPQKEYGYRNGQLLITAEPTGTSDTVWVEDSVPAGAATAGDGEGWNWVSSSPLPASGSVAHQSNVVAGVHQHYFYNASSTLTVAVGDKLFAYVYLDPANLPSEVMLQFNDGTWEHRAYWGANNLGWGTDGTSSRRYQGPLPAAGGWVRLEVAASAVDLEGHTLNGMAFSLWNGRATWDRAGKSVSAGNGSVNWLVADQLGTPRLVFDKTGSLAATKRHDYLPFGEELFAGAAARTTAQGYSVADWVRQKFTSKERDNETGLDYFLARYYSSTQARFTSPDEFAGGPDALYTFADNAAENPTFYADLTNPQSLNKYQYTYNDPLAFTDEDGHCPICVAAVAAAAVYILLSPQTTHAPTHRYSYQEPSIPSGVQAMNMATAEAIGGPILSKGIGKISARFARQAERAALQAERQQLVRTLHMRELGMDPATKGFRAAEAQAGSRLEAQVGRLSRDASGVADFVGKGGRTYDLVGAGLRKQHFNFDQVTNSIVGHLQKADRVAVDVSGLSKTQANSIKQFIGNLAPEQAGRITILH